MKYSLLVFLFLSLLHEVGNHEKTLGGEPVFTGQESNPGSLRYEAGELSI
jgi:hypothetical protein